MDIENDSVLTGDYIAGTVFHQLGVIVDHGEFVLAESPKKSSPHGSAFHGGVLRIAQKSSYVRTALAEVPFLHLPIETPP